MDHRYIEQHALADRYLEHTLAPRERADFETHLVDCQECTDRVLLAEMFHNRNGTPKASAQAAMPLATIPFRVRFVAAFKPWQLLLLGSAAAILLLLIPCWIFLSELRSLRP